MTNLTDGRPEVFEEKAEYEMVTQIENWRQQQGETCQFCDSHNVEILDVEVNGRALYDYQRLGNECMEKREYMLMFNIDKSGAQIDIRHGGSQKPPTKFVHDAIIDILETMSERPKETYAPQLKGNFFICVTGSYDYASEEYENRIQRFRNAGITKEEIYNALKPYAEPVGIKFKSTQNNQTNNLAGKTFKGAQFNSWFYADSLEEAQKNGYSYSNACFNLDSNTVIAHGTAHNESPRDFIDKNLNNTFTIDTSKPPLIKNGKTIYFAKRC
jgi:hypothetical protein